MTKQEYADKIKALMGEAHAELSDLELDELMDEVQDEVDKMTGNGVEEEETDNEVGEDDDEGYQTTQKSEGGVN